MKFKKILSLLLCVIMVSSCLTPAIVSAAGCSVEVESIEVMEGTNEAVSAISISGNPGIAYAKFAVVYKVTELAQSEEITCDLFDYVSASNIRSTQLANYLPEGEDKSDYKGFFIEVEDEDFLNVYDDGVVAYIPFELVEPVVGSTYTYYVTAIEAFDENDNEVFIEGELVEGTISYIKDENLGKYDEFTMFMAPETVEVDAGENVSIDLRLDQNPGLWSVRCMIVFPEELALETDSEDNALVENGNIFEDKALNLGLANLPLTDNRLLPKYKEMYIAEGIELEGYNSVVLYYEPDNPEDVITGSGILATLPFNTDNAVAGESYEISIYYLPGDVFRAEGGQIFTDLFPATVGARIDIAGGSACSHSNTSDITDPYATCTEDGCREVWCLDCDELIYSETIPATGHNYLQPGSVVIVPPTCTEWGYTEKTCQICGDVAIVDETEPEGHLFVDGYCKNCGESESSFDCGIYADWTGEMEGSTASSPNVYIYNNPGITYIQLAVVYKTAELALADDPSSWMFDSVSTSNIRATQLANYLPAGANASEYKGFYVTLESSDWVNVYDDGDMVCIPFSFVDPHAGEAYSYYVSVVEACDENEDDVAVGGQLVEGAIEVYKDENLGKYEDFTMFFSPENYGMSLEDGGFGMDLRVDANPGLWSIRCYIVYPDALTLDYVGNGSVFPRESDLNVGIYNLPLTSDRLVPAFKNLIDSQGIDTEGYSSTTLYFEPESPDAVIDANGILASLSFSLNEKAGEGDEYDIKVYYATGDIFKAEVSGGSTSFIDYFPATVGATVSINSGYECSHSVYWTNEVDATCTEDGYVEIICSDCGEVLEYAVIEAYGHEYEDGVCLVCGYAIPDGNFSMLFDPDFVEVSAAESFNVNLNLSNNPGIWGARFYVVYPEELSLTGYASGGVYESDCINVGTTDLPLSSDMQVPAFRDLIAEQGIETDGYCSTTFYFEPDGIYDVVSANGSIVSLSFTLDEGCNGGESYEIKVYYAEGDIFSADADSLTFVDRFPETNSCVVNVYDDTCRHSETYTETVESTCTETGYVCVICSDCGEVLSTEELPLIEHVAGAPETVPATCTEDGSKTISCTACGLVLSFEVINAPGHNYLQPGSTVIVPPTCTEGGWTQKTCQICGDVAIMDETEPDGHSFVNGTCEYCGESDGTVVIDGIYAESIEVIESATTASPSIYIGNNPGVAYVELAVVFKSAELAKNDAISSTLFDSHSTKNIKAKDIANYIPSSEDASEYKGYILTLENESFENMTANGEIAVISFDLVAPEVGATYTFYVSVVEAFDANDGEVALGEDFAEGSISYVADPNLGKYDEFTMFFAPETVEVKPGEKATLDLRLDANPGLWSIRCMIVFPEELSVDANSEGIAVVENGAIFADSDLNPGIANLPLTDDRLIQQYKEYFADNGIPTEGYNSVTLYYEPEAYDAVISGNGVLASLTFNTDNCVAGESYDIQVYYVKGDIFRAEPDFVFVDFFPDTVGATITAKDCDHIRTTHDVKYPTMHEEGFEGTYCIDCGKFISGTVIPAECSGDIIHIDRVAPACHYIGNIEYWYCTGCDCFWQDEALTQLTNSKNVILPATGSENLVHIDAVSPACHYNGNIEYWYCPDCEQFWQDEALTQLTNSKNVILPATGSENLVHIDAVSPACHYNGNIEYWYCPDCEQFWQDEALTQLTNSKNVILPATGSWNVEYVPAKDATCTELGNIEYWHCYDCDQYWQDEALTQLTNAKNVILPMGGHYVLVDDITWVDPVGFENDQSYPFIYEDGIYRSTNRYNSSSTSTFTVYAYYDCYIDVFYRVSSEQNFDKLIIRRNGYEIVNVSGEYGWNSTNIYLNAGDYVTISYSKDGSVDSGADTAYFYVEYDYVQTGTTYLVPADEVAPTCNSAVICCYCNTVVKEALDHDLVHVDYVAPNCYENGNVEYWYCRACDQYWTDSALTHTVTANDVILYTNGHSIEILPYVAPTCKDYGLTEGAQCSACGMIIVEQQLIEKARHSLVNGERIEPTCTEDGVQYLVCEVCGYTDSYAISSPGHIAGSYETTKAPTCTDEGARSQCCIYCGMVISSTSIPALGHEYGEPVVTPSSCTVHGFETFGCIRCDHSYATELPLGDHDYVNGICSVCQAVDTEAKIIVSDAKSAAGKTFRVTVDLQNNPGIVSMCLNVNFDRNALKLVAVEDEGVLGTTAHKPEFTVPYTLTWVNDTATENYTVNGTIVTLTFEVLEGTALGEYEISVSYDNRDYDIFDKDLNTVDFKTVSGTVTVVDYICGDVNGDGVVNKLDRVILTRYLANWNDYQEIDLLAADVNEDGEVNNLDRVILTRYLADWDEYPELPHVN